jgi:hypothetical protein
MNSHTLALAALGLIGCTQAVSRFSGPCPKVTQPWDEAVKGKLDLEKLKGVWRNIYDNEDHSKDYECQAIKIDTMPGANSTQVSLLQGSLGPET